MSSETISLFLNKAFNKILKDSSRRHTKLRDTIKVALDAIQGSPLSPEESPEWDKLANKLVIPLKHACETRQSKIMGVALDCLQKLMAYGLIRGAAIDEERPDKKLMDNVIETVGACYDFPDDNVQLQIIKIYLVSKNQVNITTAKATLTQMLNIVFQRMETTLQKGGINSSVGGGSPTLVRNNVNNNNNNDDNNNNNSNTNGTTTEISDSIPTEPTKPIEKQLPVTPMSPTVGAFTAPSSPSSKTGSSNVHFNDCFLIFRALCKLSMKEVPEGAGPDALGSKILSLELIQMILESSGTAFRHSERFINSAIKKYLCVSLLNNGVSPMPRVFKLSLSIFLALMSHYREHLKAEIGVFFSKIFLWILENNNSTIQQKWMVLQVLYQICKNPQTLVDIFVNYDCDLEGKDIFERMVYDLSRIAQGGNTVTGDHGFSAPAAQELKVKTLGLECLVTIMKSLVDWSKELYEQNEKENSEVAAPTDGPAPTTPTPSADDLDALDVMRKQKQFKLVVETGKQKFNVSSKRGVDFLIQGEVIQRDPTSIATFLKTTEGLDKAKIREYLGDEDPFSVSVLYAYVDLFSFEKMQIDVALRDFLSYFGVPSDDKKTDRILEKFAERYFDNNPNSGFANADAVYTLAFAIVILLGDLHSHGSQTKMTKQDWFNTNKNCNASADYEYNMLSVIYDNCAQEPLRLRGEKDGYGTSQSLTDVSSSTAQHHPHHEDTSLRAIASQVTNVLLFWSIDSRQKQLRFIRESEELVKSSQASIQEKMKRKAKFFTATHIEHVRPMFELAWCPMLAAFSVLLEDSEDSRVIALCLEGFNYAIHVACIFYMAIERSTFITSLSKFTLLDSLREMRPKNIESIKAVINLANTQGNYLQDSWAQVLKCFSLLERLHVIGSGVKINALSYTSEPDPKKFTRGFTSDFFGTKPNPKAFEEVNAEYVAQQIDTSAVDRVYTNSVHLTNSAIVPFVKCLCEVSVEEINNNTAPRIFSLQKLVEICYYNMNRLRIVWSSIWTISASHFTKIGCHDNKGIAMYAIDSLRQLSMKFLEKEELAHYTFQKEFLKPFEQIRELVIRCLAQMIQAQGKNIKSGWKSVFLVFAAAASDADSQIVHLAFERMDDIMRDYFQAIADSFFVDCVSCIAAFGWNKHDSGISQKSIDWLNFCSSQLYSGKVEPLPQPASDGVIFTKSERHTSLWFPILTGLSKVTHHKDSVVRLSALQVLFRQLHMYGRSFSKDLWSLILQKVLLPIFEPTGYDGNSILTAVSEDNEWLNTTCSEAFKALVEFFTSYFDVISFLLHAILDLVVACVLQENEKLSKKGLDTLLQLTISNALKFTDEMWSTICSEYGQIFEQNIPHEISQLQSHSRHAAPLTREISQSSAIVTSPTAANTPHAPFAPSIPSVLNQSIPQISVDGTPFDNIPESEAISPRSRSALSKSAPIRVRKTSSTTNAVMNDIALNIRAKCNVQLLAISAVNEIFFSQYSHLSTHHMMSLVDSLDVAYNFSYKINRDQPLQAILVKLHLSEVFQKLELQAILSYLKMLFKLYSETNVDSGSRKHQAEIRLISRCAHILSNVDKGDIAMAQESPASRDHPNNVAIITQVLRGYLSMTDEQFSSHLSQFYGEFVDLMLHNNKEIRQALSEVMQRVGPTFNIITEYPTWLEKNAMDTFLEKPKPRKLVLPKEEDSPLSSSQTIRQAPATTEPIQQSVSESQQDLTAEPVPTSTEPEPTQSQQVTTQPETEPQQIQEPTPTPTPYEQPKEVSPLAVQTVITEEEVTGPVTPVVEQESGLAATTTEYTVQEIPAESVPSESTSYTETTTVVEEEITRHPGGEITTTVVASGEVTTTVEVVEAEAEAESTPERAKEAAEVVATVQEPTLDTTAVTIKQPEQVQEKQQPQEEPLLDSEPTESTESVESVESNEHVSSSESINESVKSDTEHKDLHDDFVMVDSTQPEQELTPQPQQTTADPFEDPVVVAQEEVPLVANEEEHEKASILDNSEYDEDSDELPDAPLNDTVPIFDDATAAHLVDLAASITTPTAPLHTTQEEPTQYQPTEEEEVTQTTSNITEPLATDQQDEEEINT